MSGWKPIRGSGVNFTVQYEVGQEARRTELLRVLAVDRAAVAVAVISCQPGNRTGYSQPGSQGQGRITHMTRVSSATFCETRLAIKSRMCLWVSCACCGVAT